MQTARMHRHGKGSYRQGLSNASAIGHRASRRRRGREAEGTRLLNEHTPQGYRGFESLRLRHHFFCVFFNHLVRKPQAIA